MKLLFTLFLTSISLTGFSQYWNGQSIIYEYDGAGNRIIRRVKTAADPNFKQKPDQVQTGNENIMIYPNPTDDLSFLTLAMDCDCTYELSITDLSGRVVEPQQQINAQSTTTIDLSDQPTGVFFVRLTGNDELFTYRIITY